MNSWMKIPLTRGLSAMVDLQDYLHLSQWKWCASTKGYAVRRDKERILWMHRVVAETPDGMLTDHKNLNKLDNRRHNLRVATKALNEINKSTRSDNTSGYKGVYWSKQSNKWMAYITVKTKRIHLGYFNKLADGAEAYNKAAVKYYGEFARINQ